MLAQFGDVNIHGARIEVVVVNPNGLQSIVARKKFVRLVAEKSKEFSFLGGEFHVLVTDGEGLLLSVELEFANLTQCVVLVLLTHYATEDSLDTENHHIHAEWLGDVVVGTDFETFTDVFSECFGCEENEWSFRANLVDFACKRETVHLWHHHVEDAEVVMVGHEGVITFFTVSAKLCLETFCFEVFAEEHTEVFIVFA